MVGAILKFEGYCDNIFRILFRNINIEKYYFTIQFWESYVPGTINFDDEDIILSKSTKDDLFSKETKVFPEFLELFLSCEDVISEVDDYKTFLSSKYFMSIIIIDHKNIEICCKLDSLLSDVINNFQDSKLKNKKIRILYDIQMKAKLLSNRSKNDISIYE